jgi:hypothetical protein
MAKMFDFPGRNPAGPGCKISPAECEQLAAQVIALIKARFPRLGPVEIKRILDCVEELIYWDQD